MTSQERKFKALIEFLESGLPVETCMKLSDVSESEFIQWQNDKKLGRKISKASEKVKVDLWEHLLHLCKNAKNMSDQIKATTFALSRRYPEHFAERVATEVEVLSPFEKLLLAQKDKDDSEK